MANKVLPSVPRISQFMGDKTYLTPWAGSLYAVLCGMGEPRGYAELLALSGAGNRMCWTPGTWAGGSVDILSYDDPPFAPHERVLSAIGWAADIKLCHEINGVIRGGYVDEPTARTDIVASIDAGVPVIAMGVLGPPECCVVFGYEEDGGKLIGWNYFQGDMGFPRETPFAKGDWFGGTFGYFLLKKAEHTPSRRDSALAMFRAIVGTARRTDSVRGAKVGLAGWEAMLHQLEHDDFGALPMEMPEHWEEAGDDVWSGTVQGRFCSYCDALCEVHERSVILPYFEELRFAYPEWERPLGVAMDALRECARYGGYLWKHLTMDASGFEKFRTPEIRKILADEGRRAMAKDAEAVEAIEALLDAEG